MSLNSIKGSVQEVAEAIAAVLKVDVTIIDKILIELLPLENTKNL